MRYLLLNASPHAGNTWKAVGLVVKQIRALFPNADFEAVHLARLDLPFCAGCSECFRLGPSTCPHAENLDVLLKKIERCDGLIFAFTTFNMQPNALAKNFIDHLCYLLHRPRFFRQKALVVTTTGGVGGRKAASYAAGFLRAIGMNRCYELPIPSHSWNDFRPDERTRRKIKKAATRFHQDVASAKLHAPSFLMMIPYNLFRGMSRHYAPGTAYPTEDGTHWTQPERSILAYDAAVPLRNPVKRAWGHLFAALGEVAGKHVTVTYRKGEEG